MRYSKTEPTFRSATFVAEVVKHLVRQEEDLGRVRVVRDSRVSEFDRQDAGFKPRYKNVPETVWIQIIIM